MGRELGRNDRLAKVRRLLREARTSARHGTLHGAVEIALFRLPARQRDIVRRYDLQGESAADVQRALAISQTQFYRDRRMALAALYDGLFGGSTSEPGTAEPGRGRSPEGR
jgi:DNA-directed RNA polymerase specialized sigma24 family protein